jgi:hypothetical protein
MEARNEVNPSVLTVVEAWAFSAGHLAKRLRELVSDRRALQEIDQMDFTNLLVNEETHR